MECYSVKRPYGQRETTRNAAPVARSRSLVKASLVKLTLWVEGSATASVV